MEIGNIILIVAAIYGLIGFVEGWLDGKKALNKKKRIEHKVSFTLRILGAIGAWLLFTVIFGFWLPVLIVPMMLLLNSIGVDLGFNKAYGNDLGYIGKTSEFDKFIRKTPIGADGKLYQFCKLFVAGVLFFIMIM
tara:strand:+ start:11074 stop:11478 length:405 start_codon:yes stop_codon:yes gene_type:complete